VVRGVFGPNEVAEMATAFDAVQAAGLRLERSFRDGNVLFRLSRDTALGKTLRIVQWPAYVNAALDRYRVAGPDGEPHDFAMFLVRGEKPAPGTSQPGQGPASVTEPLCQPSDPRSNPQ